jgi:hypothetical protein
LGTLIPGQISELKVLAENVNSDYSVEFNIIGGELPNGLTLLPDGTLQGKVNHLTQTYFDFENSSFKIDSNNTTIDKNWYFRVRAKDVYRLSAVEKDFYITVNERSTTEYSRVFIKPFLPPIDRLRFGQFISNSSIFDSSMLYRPNDPEFGVQTSIRMPLEIGLQKVDLEKIAAAMKENFSRNFGRKRFYFGDVNTIYARDSQGTVVYELVYIDIIDDQMNGNITPSNSISVGNMQYRIENIRLTDTSTISINDQLWPRWMNALDQNTGTPIGFISAAVICYALPGYSEKIVSRIKTSGFDFKNLDFDTDRLIIDYPYNPASTSWLSYPNN